MHSLTSALDGGGWTASRADRFTPGRKSQPHLRYVLDRMVSGPQSQFGRNGEERKKSLPLSGTEPQSSSPYPSPYTDWE
jgi:hypothetical protein